MTEKIFENLTIIAACASNRTIGKNNKLICHIPGDLKRFKLITIGNPILMGRKTFESIGRPLPNRTNIILSKNTLWKPDGCIVYSDYRKALIDFEAENLFVIGGGEIYKQLLPHTAKVELTFVNKEFEGDSWFPDLPENIWKISNRIEMSCEDFSYSYLTYNRI